ncbi:hypothetical protein O181_092818 [Austropuccinia psidii MF-1]|uniref:Uncharacterized protein n=1 Tax=Austropuccinia psidii MF-1 TaxID=1389203 RepID=A0A9Q3IZA1_9BASI|nr:hypothetical protein [Austropuccinia psidii MF-1]
MQIKPEKLSKVWGHNSIHGPLKVLNVGLQGPLGPQSSINNLPFNSGRVHLLDGRGPLSMGPSHVGGNWPKATFWVLGPPEAQENLGPGGLWTIGTQNGHQALKGPKRSA